MKSKLFMIAILVFGSFVFAFSSQASTLAERLSGQILLQVQAHGEAWYIYPANKQKYFLGRPIDAFEIMRRLSLGISNKDFDSFSGKAPTRLKGRILLKVQDLGKAYYVDPETREMLYLGRPSDAFALMRNQGLGINNFNLSLIPMSGASAIPPGDVLNIVVSKPAQDSNIGLPLIVEGKARVFENNLNIRLKNANNKILVEDTATAASPDIGQYGPFSKSISYPKPGTNKGTLEVFTLSPKDGSEIEKTIISIVFLPVDSLVVKAYFSNSSKDPDSLKCGTTYPVERRIAKTQAVGQAALNEMLKGPTVNESKDGYFTNINTGAELKTLTIENGTARADFNSTLGQNVGGSCRVQAIRSQIESTLKQFPTVNNVIISIDGKTEGVLEP